MPGSQYIALSGLRTRIDHLDRLASDLANVGSTGYKGERTTTAAAERETFDRSLQSAIDTTFGGRATDFSDGALDPTGRTLDLAIDGPGFFVIDTASGPRYTRNGHFSVDNNHKLVTEDGQAVCGNDGRPMTIGDGEIRIESDGSVWAGQEKAGTLQVVKFDDPTQLQREGQSRFKAGALPGRPVDAPSIRSGALEQSNVLMADRIAELTTVSRGFEALQRSIATVFDLDTRAIEQLGRRS